jgi:hypothetical protein
MEQPEGIVILPGMAGTARGTEQLREGEVARIILPSMAVAADQSGMSYVWNLISEGDFAIAHRTDVTVGKLTSLGVEVTSGIKPGDLVAVAGVNVLREGQKVRVLLPGE